MPPSPPTGRRYRCHGGSYLSAAVTVGLAVPAAAAAVTTHRHDRRRQHVGRSPPFPLTRRRRRRQGCCNLFAAGTVRQAVTVTTAVGRSPPSPRSGRRHRCHGCCYLSAAGTVRHAVPTTAAARHDDPPSSLPTTTQSSAAHLPHRPMVAAAAAPLPRLLLPRSSGYGWASGITDRPCRSPTVAKLQQCQRPLNLISASHSLPPLTRLPLVAAAAVGSEGINATTAAATTGRGRRWKRQIHRPLTSLSAHRPSPPLPRLLLPLSRRYG